MVRVRLHFAAEASCYASFGSPRQLRGVSMGLEGGARKAWACSVKEVPQWGQCPGSTCRPVISSATRCGACALHTMLGSRRPKQKGAFQCSTMGWRGYLGGPEGPGKRPPPEGQHRAGDSVCGCQGRGGKAGWGHAGQAKGPRGQFTALPGNSGLSWNRAVVHWGDWREMKQRAKGRLVEEP